MFRFFSKALGFAGYVVQYACITHCTFEYIGDFVVCSGPSMEPTLYTNNILVTERITARMNKVQRGDIVIARCPTDPQNKICKRVVGLPGDRIIVNTVSLIPPRSNDTTSLPPSSKSLDEEIKTALADENHRKEQEQQLSALAALKSPTASPLTKEVIVPRGHVWIEGDNAANSADSRYYGPVPLGLVNGRAVCRVWPLADIKLLI